MRPVCGRLTGHTVCFGVEDVGALGPRLCGMRGACFVDDSRGWSLGDCKEKSR